MTIAHRQSPLNQDPAPAGDTPRAPILTGGN